MLTVALKRPCGGAAPPRSAAQCTGRAPAKAAKPSPQGHEAALWPLSRARAWAPPAPGWADTCCPVGRLRPTCGAQESDRATSVPGGGRYSGEAVQLVTQVHGSQWDERAARGKRGRVVERHGRAVKKRGAAPIGGNRCRLGSALIGGNQAHHRSKLSFRQAQAYLGKSDAQVLWVPLNEDMKRKPREKRFPNVSRAEIRLFFRREMPSSASHGPCRVQG